MYIKISKMRNVKTPVRANPSDAGLDFFIPDDFNKGKPFELLSGKNVLIPSGIKVEVPFGYALIFMNKSGIAAKKELLIGAQVIDCGYSGEVHIDLHNVGLESRWIVPGDKIAQAILFPIVKPQIIEVSEEDLYTQIAIASNRGSGGFGSTGA
jgi:dUTP pyrophosphatase